jgi:hypothetical protein
MVETTFQPRTANLLAASCSGYYIRGLRFFLLELVGQAPNQAIHDDLDIRLVSIFGLVRNDK